MKFAPHFGMFRNHAGNDHVDQLKFMHDEGFRALEPRAQQPLTRMAEDAIQGNSNIDVKGYRDYRGVPVVGAWTWLPDYDFGVTSELDYVEPLELPAQLRQLFWSAIGLLALVGGLVGGVLAYFAFDGFRAATINYSSFSQIAFAFDVTPGLMMQGVIYAAFLGLIGGLFPAIRAARLPISAALREL